jgi:Protein of unknown function (DUF3305)
VSRPQPLQRLPVGVVIERRRSNNPWIDVIWRPIAVLPDEPETAPWTVLDEDDTATTFYAGAATVELFASSSGFYRDNLTSGAPSLWIVLRPVERQGPFEIVAVTADPHEGEAFTQAGNDLVESVAMPTTLAAAIEAFAAAHAVETPFFKRKRDVWHAPDSTRDDDE